MILLAFAMALSLAPPQDTTPFGVAIRFTVSDTSAVFERPLEPALLLRVRREPSMGWTVTVIPRSSRLDRPNLLYHNRSWHGPYPSEVFAWSHQSQCSPDKRVLLVYRHPYEVRIRLIDCRTSGTGQHVVFESGEIEVAWRRAPLRYPVRFNKRLRETADRLNARSARSISFGFS
jgi:hypothetical protein